MNHTNDHKVVYVEGSEERRSYRLDAARLQALLLREGVAERPVAVYSIAGAYRTGKSFLLNYFLRYLRATDQSRSDGSWFGSPDESLSGFDWRSGCDPHTSGILLSQPIPVTLPNGQHISVVLMDTQGTFDRYSSVKDYSTIFAVSTLLSSVQIYNVKEDIKEDSWQHLQMFTEYGRYALESGTGEKPFQTLKFLVRDWVHDFNYAFGYEGGRKLLETNLQVGKEQLQLRKHILASFQNVECYLMPHPGLRVQDEQYDGRHSVAEDNFKRELKNLIQTMFKPENIILKHYNGNVLTGNDFFQHFKTFMEIFNSDKMPKIQTVLSASAQLAVQSAVEASRKLYRELMNRHCGSQQRRYLSKEALRERHEAARNAALALFRDRRTMADPTVLAEKQQQLNQEFCGWLTHYESLNDAKRYQALSAAKETYERKITEVNGDNPICLHPGDLLALHSTATREAVTLFDSRRDIPRGIDRDKAALVADLNKRWNELLIQNESSNKTAVSESHEKYKAMMKGKCGARPCMRPDDLQNIHDETYLKIMEFFDSRRNSYSARSQDANYREDAYKNQLIEKVEQEFYDLKITNDHSCVSIVKDAISVYSEYMKSICGPKMPCLHQQLFDYEHRLGEERALAEYHSKSTFKSAAGTEDKNKQLILEGIRREKIIFLEMNDSGNKAAVSAALKLFSNNMNVVCGVGRAKIDTHQFEQTYSNAANMAIRAFEDKRRLTYIEGLDLSSDKFKDYLTEDISHRREQYRLINERNPETESAMSTLATTLGGGLLAMGAAYLAGGIIGGTLQMAVGAVSVKSIIKASSKGAGYAAGAANAVWEFLRPPRNSNNSNKSADNTTQQTPEYMEE